MSNPFITSSSVSNAYSQNAIASGYTYGGSTGSVTRTKGTSEPTKTSGTQSYQQDINEVGLIGAQKRADFENGLGGTNNPDDHALFLVA